MGYILNRLGYLGKFYNRGQIQKQTGIHWTRQEAVIRGTATLTSTERYGLQGAYMRQNYSIFRDSGMSHRQAFRFSNASVVKAESVLAEMEFLTDRLATGASASKAARLAKQGITSNIHQLYAEALEAVKTGLRKSKLPMEDWSYWTK